MESLSKKNHRKLQQYLLILCLLNLLLQELQLLFLLPLGSAHTARAEQLAKFLKFELTLYLRALLLDADVQVLVPAVVAERVAAAELERVLVLGHRRLRNDGRRHRQQRE